MRLPRLRGQPRPVRRPLLPRLDPVHRLRPGGGLPVSVGGVARQDRPRRLGRDDAFPGRAGPRLRLRLEEGGARMGVILDPRHENERPSDLEPPDPRFFGELQSEVADKGFLVTSTEVLCQWACTGSLSYITFGLACCAFEMITFNM